MREFESCFADQFRSFVAYREASGRWNEASYGPNLCIFDRYCRENFPDAESLTQEMVDSWCRQRETETNNSCRSRIYVVHSIWQHEKCSILFRLNFPERKNAHIYRMLFRRKILADSLKPVIP